MAPTYCGTACNERHYHYWEVENDTQKQSRELNKKLQSVDFFQERRNEEMKRAWKKDQYAKVKGQFRI